MACYDGRLSGFVLTQEVPNNPRQVDLILAVQPLTEPTAVRQLLTQALTDLTAKGYERVSSLVNVTHQSELMAFDSLSEPQGLPINF